MSYTLINKNDGETKDFETKEDLLHYLETVYWYDFDSDIYEAEHGRPFKDLADFHNHIGLEEALKMYTQEDWIINEK